MPTNEVNTYRGGRAEARKEGRCNKINISVRFSNEKKNRSNPVRFPGGISVCTF